MQSGLQIDTAPDDKPKAEAPAEKEPDVTLEFEGGRKEKADLTKIKGLLWWFNGEVPRLAREKK